MKFVRITFATVILSFFAIPAEASLVFDFSGDQGVDVDGQATGTTTVGGITATVSANVGVLNRGTTNFGINSPASNETTLIDSDAGKEILSISFSESVFIQSFVTRDGNSATEGSYTIGSSSGTFAQLTGGGAVTTTFSGGVLLPQGDLFTIQHDNGASGFSFDSITVTAVPEPSSVILLGLGSAAGGLYYRRKTKSLAGLP